MEASETHPMKGGAGPCSYVNNSDRQRKAADRAFKAIVTEAIIENLDTTHLPPFSNSYAIADLGCSTGPNTFIVMKKIIQAIKHRHQMEGHDDNIEFQCFFSDHVSNDFNTLFLSLAIDRRYFVAGVPGSFYERLFGKASINFFSSTFALHWLSCVPKELSDSNSLAYNKGRITYANAHEEVGEAFVAQFSKDMESFLHARAEETVPGGLISILMCGRSDGTPRSKSVFGHSLQPLESCLVDMANERLVDTDQLSKFNIPIYTPSTTEIRLLVQGNGCFNIVKLEELHQEYIRIPSAAEIRAVSEGVISNTFGVEILDELYDRYTKKVDGLSPIKDDEGLAVQLFILLKRNY
ncbi:SAM dependent carboxyl methyltransferase [Dillenia turbinata]|uniref:SAM dependent carboxyl methyltransferase n=1 Tax=Dillenia turbinata TaxID=194707 RepID=A0AAN8YZT5_9MAGN